MPRTNLRAPPPDAPVRVRRGYFECRYGQLHLHHAMPPGGGFEEGTPLVCIHELPGTGRMFAPLLALFGSDRSAYAPDLPGFGESDPPGAFTSLADYVGALGDFIDTMRLRKVDLVGVRSGAVLAAELALARPTQVARLVMLGPALSPSAGASPPPLGAPPWERSLLEALAQYGARERLPRLAARLLVLRFKDDPLDGGARVRDLVPAARLVELEQSPRDLLAAAPERLATTVRDFLRG